MSDQDQSASESKLPGGGLRRVGRGDRKQRLDARGPLFPDEVFDDSEDEDDDFWQEVDDADPPDAQLAPPAERFPPLKPAAPPPPARPAPPQPPSKFRNGLANTVATLFLLATLAAGVYFAFLLVNPYSALNPLPPPTPLPILITTTPLPPTPTLPPTVGPTVTFTPLAIAVVTDAPPPTLNPVAPAVTFTPAAFSFTLTENGVIYAPNGNGEGCNWASIAGSVTDLDGEPLDGFGVRIVGTEDGLNATVFSGTAAAFGPGGFELFLNGTPQQLPYTLQLVSPQGAPVSAETQVVTSANCDQNVAIVNFVQNREF